MTETFFVTGAAGFIGSNMVDRLLSAGHQVVGFDNFSTGFEHFLAGAKRDPNFRIIRGDACDPAQLQDAMRGCTFVMHFSANADIRFGTNHPRKDLEQNTIATFNVLEAMRANEIKKIVFSSTGSVYGETTVIPTPEDAPFPIQTSLYSASKVACEGLIQAYCAAFDMQSFIFRFVGILGERYTHGHIFDFYKRLLANPNELQVLGNGKQKKSYLYIQDCIDGIFSAIHNVHDQINVFNLGSDEYCEVNDSIGWITEFMNASPAIHYSGGDRGWVGDNPFIFLDASRIRQTGWKPKLTIKEAVLKTVAFLAANDELLVRS